MSWWNWDFIGQGNYNTFYLPAIVKTCIYVNGSTLLASTKLYGDYYFLKYFLFKNISSFFKKRSLLNNIKTQKTIFWKWDFFSYTQMDINSRANLKYTSNY
jgi:hypothetical protein